MTARDPRQNPAKGDLLRWGKCSARVTDVSGDRVRYWQEGIASDFMAFRSVDIESWRRSARGAAILTVAG